MDANAGVFEAILTKDDVIISDRLVHASLVDGIRLCSAMHDTIKHSDMEHLEEKLQLHSDKRSSSIRKASCTTNPLSAAIERTSLATGLLRS